MEKQVGFGGKVFNGSFDQNLSGVHLGSDSDPSQIRAQKMLHISFLNIARGALELSDLLLEVCTAMALLFRRASDLGKVTRSRQLRMT